MNNENNNNNTNTGIIMKDDNDYSLTVSDLTELIKGALKVNFDKPVCVIGEISNFKPSAKGVFYTLKDEDAMINCVMWNYGSRTNKADIVNGKKVKVYGNLVIFSKSGSYNLNAYRVELLGVGDLHQEYSKLQEHYSKLGFFDENKKKKLPTILKNIGIITAIDGAALQDFLYVVKKNNFVGKIYIKNCIVQGKDCPLSIVKGISELDKMNLDTIVIARGGGSFEDLFGFSNELVINEIHKCKTCTISAIGHEVDFMLSDYVADIRAPTPSIAGEIISCKKEGTYNINEVNDLKNKLKHMIHTKLSLIECDIMTINNKLKSPFEIMERMKSDIELMKIKLLNMIKSKVNLLEMNLNSITKILNQKNVVEQYSQCNVFTFTNEQINNINDFNKYTSKKKKLKLKFIDGEVLFDIRNIKIITYE